MAKPSSLPEWDTTQVNSITPDITHKAQGWLAPAGVGEKPPLETFNYWMNETYRWIKAINDLGILGYDTATDYTNGSVSVGTDREIYKCRIANGPSSSVVDPVGDLTGTWIKTGTPTKDITQLKCSRSHFSYYDASNIIIKGGGYPHFGTTNQILTNLATISYPITSPGVSQFQYIYVSDAAIVSAGVGIITAATLINSTTVPTYDPAKNGLYNGNDLCIFAVWIDASGNISGFDQAGEKVIYHDDIVEYISTPLSATWTDITSTAPSFAKDLICTISAEGVSLPGAVNWRSKTGTGSGHVAIEYTGTSIASYNTLNVPIDSSGVFQIYVTTAISIVRIFTNGWCIPDGM